MNSDQRLVRINPIRRESLDKYNASQLRLLRCARKIANGNPLYGELFSEYTRMTYAIKPSPAERAVLVLATALKREREQRRSDTR